MHRSDDGSRTHDGQCEVCAHPRCVPAGGSRTHGAQTVDAQSRLRPEGGAETMHAVEVSGVDRLIFAYHARGKRPNERAVAYSIVLACELKAPPVLALAAHHIERQPHGDDESVRSDPPCGAPERREIGVL